MSESIAYYEKPAARLRAIFLISLYLLIDPLPYARVQMSAISGHEAGIPSDSDMQQFIAVIKEGWPDDRRRCPQFVIKALLELQR